jgi:hypothetical protein
LYVILSFVLFFFTIVLSVLLLLTVADYPFGILSLFFKLTVGKPA